MSAHKCNWLSVRNESTENPEILITGVIGGDWWSDDGMREKEFLDALNAIDKAKRVTIGINSEGGSVQDGLGIYNAIKRRGNCETRIDGYALSIASIIALAGDRVVSPRASVWMIHDPWAFAQGNAEDMRRAALMLEKHGDTLSQIYSEETGRDRDECREAMKSETWFTGEEAVEWGLADSNEGTATLAKLQNNFKRTPKALSELSDTMTASGRVFSGFLSRPEVGGKEPPRTEHTTNRQPMDANANTQAQGAPAQNAPNIDFGPVIAAIAALGAKIENVKPQPNLPDAGAPPLPISPVKADPRDDVMAFAGNRARLTHIVNNRQKFYRAMNANTFTNMTNTVLAGMALEAFTDSLAPIAAFSLNFSAEAAQRGDKVKVMQIPASDAAADFAGTYLIQDADATGLDITIDKIKYVSWSLTTDELLNQPQLSMERFAMQKGAALALSMFQDVLSVVTAANYGDTETTNFTVTNGDKVTVTAANFDSLELAYVAHAADCKKWPRMGRSLLLTPGHYNALFEDATIVGSNGVLGNSLLLDKVVPRVMGMDVYESTAIPANAENLVGFACVPNAILIANRVRIPDANVANRPDVQVLSDPKTGASIVLRDWFDPDNDAHKRVLEVTYGYRVGDSEGIVRIESA